MAQAKTIASKLICAVAVLVAAFVAVVALTRPTTLPQGEHPAKIVSAEASSDNPNSSYFLRLQQQDVPQGTVAPVFKLKFSGSVHDECPSLVGKVVTYEYGTWDGDGSVTIWRQKPDGIANWDCFAKGRLAPPFDPLVWFHKKEKSLGLDVFSGMILASLVALVIGILSWFAPIYIAKKRSHPNLVPIAVITILLGWTFIGWAVCLAWSLSNIKKSQDTVPEPAMK